MRRVLPKSHPLKSISRRKEQLIETHTAAPAASLSCFGIKSPAAKRPRRCATAKGDARAVMADAAVCRARI